MENKLNFKVITVDPNLDHWISECFGLRIQWTGILFLNNAHLNDNENALFKFVFLRKGFEHKLLFCPRLYPIISLHFQGLQTCLTNSHDRKDLVTFRSTGLTRALLTKKTNSLAQLPPLKLKNQFLKNLQQQVTNN